MDRLSRVLAVGQHGHGFGTVLTASGCRSMRSEVPPGKPYSTTGGQPPTSGLTPIPVEPGPGPRNVRNGLTGRHKPDGNQSMTASNGMSPSLVLRPPTRAIMVHRPPTITDQSGPLEPDPDWTQFGVRAGPGRSIQPDHQPCLL